MKVIKMLRYLVLTVNKSVYREVKCDPLSLSLKFLG